MPKTKISEFSATPANNTDIDSINISEGCAPSGINDAIRELMAQLKDFQTGAVGDSFNGPVGTTTAAAGAFTTLAASGAVTLSGGTANGVAYLNGSKVVTSGSALTFDGTNLGVGVASPQAKIHATGTIKVATGNAQGILALGDGAGTTVNCGIWRGAANAPTTDGNYLNFGGYDGLVFAVGNAAIGSQSEVGRFTSTGLGIGTSSPASKLHVDNGSGCRLYVGLSNNIYEQAYDHIWQTLSGASTKMTLDSSGNLGLGVTPSAWSSSAKALEIGIYAGFYRNASGITAMSFNSYQNTSNADTYRVSSNPATKYEMASGHAWYVAPSGTAGNAITFTQAMTLDSSGNLLINTTSNLGGGKLDVSSTTRVAGFTTNSASGSQDAVNIANQSNTAYNAIRFWVNGRPDVGSVIGTISCTTSATAYNTSSDYRLKDNPQTLIGSGEFIDALKPKTWNWKVDGSKGVGFLAHEAQAVSPSSVTGQKDATDEEGKPIMQAMEYGSAEFIANIIAELQSLRQRVAQLEAQ